MKKTLNQWKRKELLALPIRDWQMDSVYDSLLLVPTGKKHDSGWSLVSIVGVRNGEPVEQASCCSDDIEWVFPNATRYGSYTAGQLRMDCLYPAGVFHPWTRNHKFQVGAALSSVTVTLVDGTQTDSPSALESSANNEVVNK